LIDLELAYGSNKMAKLKLSQHKKS